MSKAIRESRYTQSRTGKDNKAGSAPIKRPAKATYAYKAIVDRVIDGNTLHLRIDFWLQAWKDQRARLAEIDAPAMDEPKGQAVYKFVLKEPEQADFIMAKTNKIGIYARHVGHVFYSPKNLSKEEIFGRGDI